MAVIFGFDLSEMSLSAFSHRNMFDKRWHLRRERFVVYQVAMILSLVAECLATYSLAKYEFHQSRRAIEPNYAGRVHNHDLLTAGCTTIVFCVLVATLFGADFFFLLFWPRRIYPLWYNAARQISAVVITLGMAASSWMSTVVVATHAAYITGVDESIIHSVYRHPPLVYHHFQQNIAWVVLSWLGFVSTLAATAIMIISVAHDTKFGTEPKDVKESEKTRDNKVSLDSNAEPNETSAPEGA